MIDERGRLLDLHQIAERLTLSETTVIKRMQAGKIPGAFKIGREWRMKAGDLEAYIDRLRGEALTAQLSLQESQEAFNERVKQANKAGWRDLDAIIAEEVAEAA